MKSRIRTLCLAVFLAGSAGLDAQDTWATIIGRVVDSSRATIPEASIQASGAGLAVAANTETDTAGQFSLTFLPAGTYELEITAVGFRPMSKRAVTVSASQTLDLTFTLEVEDLKAGVTLGGIQ